MAALKRHSGTWVLILLLAAGFFLLRDRRGSAVTTALPPLVINVATPFSVLDNGPNDSNPAVGVFEYCGDVTIGPTGSITCDDVGTPASACPITLVILGNLVIQEGGSIHADNTGNGGGGGGNITIDVGGPNFTLCGPNSTTPGCANAANNGAFISSQQLGGGNGTGGNILIRVGGVKTIPDPVSPTSPAIGVCESPVICGVTIPLNTGDALIENGATATLSEAKIITDAQSGRAGNIALYTGHNIKVFGTVEAQGFQGAGHGGAITLDACCDLLIGNTGFVNSQGRDPGPDRVHLEACTVTVYGLVQSTGPAHENPEPNCTPPERPDRPANSTACVEIWAGTTLTISSVLPHKAEVNADVGFSGGTSGLGWIDILANSNIQLNDGTGDNFVNPLIPGPNTDFMVHANMNGGLTNSFGGLIAVISKSGSVSTLVGGGEVGEVGQVLQANADSAAGGDGGSVTVLAGGNPPPPGGDVTLGTLTQIQAKGNPDANGKGGLIEIRSYQGDITGTVPGSLNASGDLAAFPGVIHLTACANPISYSGTRTPPETPLGGSPGVCAPLHPTFPAPAETLLPAATCAQACQPATPTPTNTTTRTTPTVTSTPVPCPDHFALTRTVDTSLPVSGTNFHTLQDAYNAAAPNAGEVIGIFSYTTENVTLGDAKTLRITTCKHARVTAADNSLPVFNITSTGRLTIVSLESVGGSVGWRLATGGHTLKSIRANGASQYGVEILSLANGNSVNWNDVSGNGPGAGIRVAGGSNTLAGGTVGPNTGDGVDLIGNSNTLSGATIRSNTGDGVLVTGSTNTVKDSRINQNGQNGILVTGPGSGNTLSGNQTESGKGNTLNGVKVTGNTNQLTNNKMYSSVTADGFNVFGTGNKLKTNTGINNFGFEFNIGPGDTDQGGNKANGVNCTFGAGGGTCN